MSLKGFIQSVSAVVFDYRKAWLVVFAILTALFAASASRLAVDAGFNKMVPLSHPYMIQISGDILYLLDRANGRSRILKIDTYRETLDAVVDLSVDIPSFCLDGEKLYYFSQDNVWSLNNQTLTSTVLLAAGGGVIVGGALADTRGARGRARAVRDAARNGAEISEAVLAGLRPVHAGQIELFRY